MSLRYRLRTDDEHDFSEAIGVVMLTSGLGSDASITILTKKGERVEIATSDVLAAKVFPV